MQCCLHATWYWAEKTWPAPGNSVMDSPQTGRTRVELQPGGTSWAHRYHCSVDWTDTSREREECIQQLHEYIQSVLLSQERENTFFSPSCFQMKTNVSVLNLVDLLNGRKMKAIQCHHIFRLFNFFTVAGVANLPQSKKTANSHSGNVLGGHHIHLCTGGGAQCAAPLEPAGIIAGHELKDLSGSKI